MAAIPISTLLLLLLLFAIPTARSASPSPSAAIERSCDGTLYPDLCVSTLAAVPGLAAKSLPSIISSTLNRTQSSVHSSRATVRRLRRASRGLDPLQRLALADCLDLLDLTVAALGRAARDLARVNASSGGASVDDLKTVLSAAMTNQYTCLDGFAFVNDSTSLRPLFENELFNISRLVSNSLAMAKKLPRKKRSRSHKEVLEGYGRIAKGFPRWISAADQELLVVNGTAVADLVVAKDGSGNFTTVTEAVGAAPNNSATRFVIYVKQGGYFENVEVASNKTNLMFIGDGIGKTVIKASRNVVDGWTTYRSATVAIVGNGFLARDITIENAAGPSKHQAVALRSNSDLSAFYRCSFVGYQDTLYAHSQRQFYRDCDVYGTVDFVFGNAAVVLQRCNLYARRPDAVQKNIFTAQGREDPNQTTGISMQQCKIAAAEDLLPVVSEFKSFLGRPWKKYSRTVVMQSKIEGLIDPAGWLEWDGDFALDTLYYGEYMNRGPGANTTNRVTWPGYRVINSTAEASNFTVSSFIQGDLWLVSSLVPFSVGLTVS
ncbi:putative pectinesterase [Iris pallida]|uniref:Pectinesterase n=1 Tax=Iris pallida TaxID=29817 RepID=A0AAX6DGH1_IRIPA|nr:putative pectinesterase [Iris pallida]